MDSQVETLLNKLMITERLLRAHVGGNAPQCSLEAITSGGRVQWPLTAADLALAINALQRFSSDVENQ